LESFLKILSILVVIAGAFLVYGARFITEKTVKNHGGLKSDNQDENEGINTDDSDNGDTEYKINIVDQKTLSFKKAGLLLIMAVSILVLVAFR